MISLCFPFFHRLEKYIHSINRKFKVEVEIFNFVVSRIYDKLNKTTRKLIEAIVDSEYRFDVEEIFIVQKFEAHFETSKFYPEARKDAIDLRKVIFCLLNMPLSKLPMKFFFFT